MTEFRVLGPLAVWREGREVPAPTRMLRRLLTLLLSQVNKPISMESIIDALWEGVGPRTARKSLIVYVSRLRQLVGGDHVRQELDGYVLRIDETGLDSVLFDRLVDDAAAATARGEHETAGDLLTRALQLWRGPAYAESSDIALVAGERDRLEDRRIGAVEQKAQLDLDLGRHVGVAADLAPFLGRHPYRERLRSLLMVALYRGGLQVEALELYRQFREQLADELGLDPSLEFQQLQHWILTNDRRLLGPPKTEPKTRWRFLPRDMPEFVGRGAEMEWLDRKALGGSAPVVISAIAGSAGVGKTVLAVHWAHRVAHHFPDGQLYVNLRGYDLSDPLTPLQGLTHLLRCLGVPPDKLYQELDVAAAMYRSLLAGKRMLILLDNARAADQIRPLLPADPGCVAVITSRDRLSGLIVADGAQRMTLDMLTSDEALDLLRCVVGADRVAAELPTARKIIDLCGGLPLALRIAGAHLADRSDDSIERYVAELTAGSLVSALRVDGDEHRGLDAVLTQSYRLLSEPARRLLRMLSLHPGEDIGIAATASLAGLTLPEVKPLLDELTRASLLTEPTAGRYAFHDLIGAYAAEQLHKHDTAANREAALRRMLDHYLHSAYAADRILHPVRRRLVTLGPPAAGVTPEAMADRAEAVTWFRLELAALLSAARHAYQAGLDAYTWELAWSCDTILDWHGHWDDFLSTNQNAVIATQRLGDVSGHAYAHCGVARAYIRLHRYDDAHIALHRALDLLQQIDDRVGQGNTHMLLNLLLQQQNRYPEALTHTRQALALFEEADAATRARCLNATAWTHVKLGEYKPALDLCKQALTLLQEIDDRDNSAATWDTLGLAHHHLGHHHEAVACYQRAITIYRDIGNRYYESCSLDHLGDTHQATRDHDSARDAWQQALTILIELDHPDEGQIRAKLE